MPRLGAHLSIAGGHANAVAAAVRFRCDCLQIFVKNQRQWQAAPLTDEQVASFALARQSAGLAPVIVHGNYLINLACPNKPLWDKSYAAFADEVTRSALLGVEFFVLHPGSHLGAGEGEGIARIVAALDRLSDEHADLPTIVLLENTAGQGYSIGWRFEQLAEILSAVADPKRVGVCLDSCHLLAAGYDIRSADKLDEVVDQFDRIVGLGKLKAMHLNDSKREPGSRVDRHEHIGQGAIGRRGFAAIVNHPRLAGVPMVIETPKGFDPKTGREWDEINLNLLRRLMK